jgi:hypothetical protein
MGEDRSGGDRRVRHIGRSILSGLPLEFMSSLGSTVVLIPGRLRAVSRWHCTGMNGGAGEFCNLPSLALRLALGAFRGEQPRLGLHRQVV